MLLTRAANDKPQAQSIIFAPWKWVVLVLALSLSLLYALPNAFREQPVLQISGANARVNLTEVTRAQISDILSSNAIVAQSVELEDDLLTVTLTSKVAQQRARAALENELGSGLYTIALNSSAQLPDWLEALGAKPLNLGLDLRGGVHFLLEVDIDTTLEQRLDVFAAQARTSLRQERIRSRGITRREFTLPDYEVNGIAIAFADASTAAAALEVLREEFLGVALDLDVDGEELSLVPTAEYIRELEDFAISQNLTTLRNRVNELGVSSPVVQRSGRSRIVLQLPGVDDSVAAKRIVGATANLEFRLEAASTTGSERFVFRNDERDSARLERDIIITGGSVVNAQPGFDENGLPQVNISLDTEGGKLMNRATRSNVGRRMGVLFVESSRERQGDEWRTVNSKSIISLATIQSALGNQFRITGLYNQNEASELSLLLRAGALAAPIYFVEERTIGPSLGLENIKSGLYALLLGFALVFMYMVVVYRSFGMVANVSLIANLLIMVALLSVLGATLTLPGIAGIVLTVGMAVDANVLIFSRIKEELKVNSKAAFAIKAGFDRALIAIVDANLTTLLVAIILFTIGTGPIKGFAVTLSLGILISLFTAVMLARGLIYLLTRNKQQIQFA